MRHCLPTHEPTHMSNERKARVTSSRDYLVQIFIRRRKEKTKRKKARGALASFIKQQI